MYRRLVGAALGVALVAGALVAPSLPASAASKGVDLEGTIKAGYGVADNTWHVGAGAGQYTDKFIDNGGQEFRNYAEGGQVDPHNHSIVQDNSYGVQSRLTFRAIVVEDAEGDQVAFVKRSEER